MSSSPESVALHGLTEAEAQARLLQDGYNEITGDGRRSVFAIILEVCREPMLLLLLAAAAIYLLLGDIHDAMILGAFAGLSILITIIQQGRTERAIEALRDYCAPVTLVIRDGVRQHVPARELVSGDLMVIAEGDRIAADGWIINNDGLHTDEALLTGESIPVMKTVLDQAVTSPPKPGGEGLPYVYSGSLVVRGEGIVRIAATGARSEIGKIGQSLATLEMEAPRLTIQTRQLVRWFAVLGLGASLLATLLYGLFRDGWLNAVLAGIALGMSMLPEEFPVVLTVFMAMGALRMSQARVLTRRGAAIETLGAATVLCTDKTGTLTQNRMEIAELRLPDGRHFAPPATLPLVLPEEFIELAGLGILACAENPFDPMETAFHDLGSRNEGRNLSWLQDEGWTLHRHYPLDPELLAMSHVWGSDASDEHVIATKGAPEAIAELCGMNLAQRKEMDDAVRAMAAKGLRVLGVAEARWSGAPFPESQRHFSYTYRGLVGLADPIRESVPDAVHQLQGAGIRVLMITGDYPVTAQAIAAKAGIRDGEVMTGEELAKLSDAELAERIRDVAVFARVIPAQKLRIVQALKASGEIVAMTGDGVNDAPSLKAAHIGIAMGTRGTDVAREASSIVLLDDNFGSIVAAVRLGRRIYDNIRKAMGFIAAVHIPIGGLALIPLIVGWPIILGPMHIAILEMIIDPVCSLAFEAEPEEDDIMRRSPRRPDEPLFSRILVGWSVLQGMTALVLLILLVIWYGRVGSDDIMTRSVAFSGLVLAVLVLVFVNRAFGMPAIGKRLKHNAPLAIIVALVVGTLTLMFGVPGIASIFRVTPLGWTELLAVLTAACGLFGLLSLSKQRFHNALSG